MARWATLPKEVTNKLTFQRNGGRQQKWMACGCSGTPMSPGGRTNYLTWQAVRPEFGLTVTQKENDTMSKVKTRPPYALPV
jgi:hypothetical protein